MKMRLWWGGGAGRRVGGREGRREGGEVGGWEREGEGKREGGRLVAQQGNAGLR